MALLRVIEDDGSMIAIWQTTESEEELKELVNMDLADIYSYPKRRIERMAVRAILNSLGINDEVCYHQNGRPYFKEKPIHISISHAGRIVVVALNKSKHIGIDVESINRNYKAVSKKYLTSDEQAWINDENLKFMSLAWCTKEAVYKLPWKDFKCFNTDINIKKVSSIQEKGIIEAEVFDQNSIHPVILNYLFFSEFCLVWIVR